MAGTTLVLSSSFTSSSRPLSTFSLPDQSYVLSIAALPAHYAAAASAPANSIHLLDKADPRNIVRVLTGHAEGITHMRAVGLLHSAHNVLLSCGRDGTVKSWDERMGAVGVQMQSSGRRAPLLCCDASPDGFLVAAGTVLQGEDASILYWDPRNPVAPLRQHTSTHSDDITAVQFSQRGTEAALLSASTDGLLCISNPHEADEDEATIHVANWGCSISKAGWIPQNSPSEGPQIWATSDMETLSFWSNELDPVRQVDRDTLTQPDPIIPWVTDYIVDCHNSRNGSFHVFAGSNEGDVALLSPHSMSTSWSLEQSYTRGHAEVIRCVHWDEAAGLLLTGGEDARLNVWSSPAHYQSQNTEESKSMDVDPDSPSRKRVFGSSEELIYKYQQGVRLFNKKE
ncbi:WD40 repeat-like protein [Fomitiporia mediterranea MF3/22]|uniref:WD40 repeat-like protein n=1 Tax=Fomitiporia mediterranea (strain MF3/22) TaxID=694068 RepID=UPI0004409B3D|nr:WD40 repeat-like protein [Fomitiporia mediterranea MF3/22]EJD00973.1 WD40 repeat-like protein [Fomitiporia mediterranea MF3/22]